MRKLLLIVPQLLLIGLAWGQVDLDKLVLKDGTTYFGEYSKIEGKIVYFKPHDAFTFQPISIKQNQTLKLKDGHFIIVRGHAKKIIPLAIEEYQKLSTKEKAIYDANLYNVNKWALYMPMSTMFFGGFAGLYYILMGVNFGKALYFQEVLQQPVFI